MKKVVIALGGNAITREFEEGNIYQQFANTRRALVPVVDLIEKGYQVVLTHGNGPQVGNMLIRVEESRDLVPPVPLGVIVADLQGGMGYMIQQTLQNKLLARGIDKKTITTVTQVLVDKDDPSIRNPTKFVGPIYKENQVEELVYTRGWIMKEDIGRGWRRVVPSPIPREIVEQEIVCHLIEQGYVVLSCGGGGIPVYRENDGSLEGVDAVIDKDLASAVLATTIRADALFILTRVEQVAINYASPNQENILNMTIAQAEKWLAEGQFPAGSMGPKIQAAINFLKAGGKECIITSTEKLLDAIAGKSGTTIRRYN
ncbi:MAG: carbamate kinase [bacterium]